MKIKLNVKDKSVSTFLKERILPIHDKSTVYDNGRPLGTSIQEMSPYQLMKDEMFFKKDGDIKVGEIVKIELYDHSRMTGKELINTYIYKAEEYDDIAIKMVLKDFGVALKKESSEG